MLLDKSAKFQDFISHRTLNSKLFMKLHDKLFDTWQ